MVINGDSYLNVEGDVQRSQNTVGPGQVGGHFRVQEARDDFAVMFFRQVFGQRRLRRGSRIGRQHLLDVIVSSDDPLELRSSLIFGAGRLDATDGAEGDRVEAVGERRALERRRNHAERMMLDVDGVAAVAPAVGEGGGAEAVVEVLANPTGVAGSYRPEGVFGSSERPARTKTAALAKCSEYRELGASCRLLGTIVRPS